MNVKGVMNWLLEDNQPSLRYLALTQLLDRPQDDGEVQSAKERIPDTGWAAEILTKQKPGGWWAKDESLYRPKYISTNWMLLILSDLGLTRKDRRIANACELWIKRFAKKDGGFGIDNDRRSELCVVGNTARALEVRLRRPPKGHQRFSMARQEPVKIGRLVMFRFRQKFGFMGRHERVRRVPEAEVDPEHEALR